jgi:ComF family protein
VDDAWASRFEGIRAGGVIERRYTSSPMIVQNLSRLGGAALDLIYPPRCALCDRLGSFLCAECIGGLPRADGRRCDACWLPLWGAECAACAEHPTSLDQLRSVFRYDGDVRRLVHAFKFGGLSALGKPLASLLAACYEHHALEADVVVPVPLTTPRRRSRGYNQASLLARELAPGARLPVLEALRRRGSAIPQTASPNAEQRRLNVIGAFEPGKSVDVAGRRVLLVDDVATTGATLSACAGVLRSMGASAVLGLTLARED